MMRIIIVVGLAALVAGCQKENPNFCPTHPGEQGCPGDGGIDAPVTCDPAACPDVNQVCVDHVCVSKCFGSGPFELCVDALPTAAATLPATLDTEIAKECAPGQPMWPNNPTDAPKVCLVVATAVTIDTLVDVTGTRPLVIASTGTIDLTGVLDVASHVGKLGPAANTPPCTDGGTGANNTSGGGGGAGGSFVALGGVGGGGDNNNAVGGTPGLPLALPRTLRGGCNGHDGGRGGGNEGQGGIAGGVVYLAAHTAITFGAMAGINASGAGGGGEASKAGGGGGGSGGMVVLSAPNITLDPTAYVMANGGGGAAGQAGSEPVGENGHDPVVTAVTVGGLPGMQGSTGGSGAGQNGMAGRGTQGSANQGGGGGGGGMGLIYAAAVSGGTLSPLASPLP